MKNSDFENFKKTLLLFKNEILLPMERYVELNDTIPDNIISKMKKLGLFGLTIPIKYGGSDLNIKNIVDVLFLMGQTLPAFQAIWGTNIGIGSKALLHYGSTKQKEKYLPSIANGDIITAFALTEENAGSDAYNINCSASKTGAGWILNGRKKYITNAPEAHLYNIVAKSSSTGATIFLVERDNIGIHIGNIDKKMGHRGSHTAEILLTNCQVSENDIIGNVDEGLTIAIDVLVSGRIHVSAIAIGMAERLLDECIKYSKYRKQFSKPISKFQMIQSMFADCATEIYAAKSMVKETARRYDDGENIKKESSMCKYYSTEMLNRVADIAVQIHGGKGYMSDNIVETFYRDARLFKIYEGTNEIQKIIVAKEILKDKI